MKTVQKLEIGFGLATLVSTLIVFYVTVLPAITDALRDNSWATFRSYVFQSFLLLIFPSFCVGIASTIHAAKGNHWAFLVVLLGGSILSLLFGIYIFSFAIFYFLGWIGGFLASTPGYFALATMFAALRTKKLFSEPK
jgi:hypothetical protein